MTRGLGVTVLVTALVAACGGGGEAVTTDPTVGAVESAEQVAVAVLDALAAEDVRRAASLTAIDQMAWLAMAEGASLEQAVALAEAGADQVAVNYWTGFVRAGALPAVVVDAVEEVDVGSHRFAIVRAGDLRLVLRAGPPWRVDVVASFGAGLAQRLAEAVSLVGTNRGAGADLLRAVLVEQQDSVEVAATDPSLTGPARAGLEALAETLATMAS